MNWRQKLLLTGAFGALPALSGCVAAIVPVAAASLAAKKRIEKRKAEQAKQHYVIVAQTEMPPAEAALAPVPAPVSAPLAPEPPPPALSPSPALSQQRVAVFAGEGSTRASLAPTSVVQGAGMGTPGPRLYTVTDGPAKAESAQSPTIVTLPAGSLQAQFQPAPVAKALAKPVVQFAAAPAPTNTSAVPEEAPQQLLSARILSTSPKPAPAPVPARPALVQPPAKPAIAVGPALVAGGMGNKSSGYPSLAAFAISHANSPQSDSALDVIDPNAPLSAPHRAQCGGQAPAVMIDLDPGLSVFDPASAAASPGLSEALAALRAAGITVLWTSALPVEKAEIVHAALARAQLDPMRTDRLLLLNGAGDRKQARRNSAAHNWCVIAMAGDRRGDFDEAFDYLRDPDAVIPADSLFGDGWFIAPAPMP